MSLFSELETLGELIADNLTTQGVTSTANEGLTTLANKILDIEGGGKKYQRVEYLQATGSQYINTEYILKSTDKVEVVFNSQGNITYEAIFGARKTNYTYNAYVVFSRFGGTNRIVYNRTGQEKQGNTITTNTTYKIITQNDTCTVYDQNGTVVDTITTTGTINDCVNPCGLFTLNTDTGTGFTKDTYSNMKIYKFKITSNDGTVQRDMYPVRDGTVGGMYDKVTETFYATYGTFQYGEDIEGEIIYEDDCTTNNTSSYDTEFHYSSTTNSTTLSFSSASNGYNYYGTGGEAFAGKIIPSIRGKDNIKISIDVYLRTSTAYNQFYIGMTDILSQTSGNIDFFRIRGDKQVDFIHNNAGTEAWKQTNVSTFYDSWVTLEFKREGNTMTGTVYKDDGTELVTTTQTLNTYTNPYYFFGLNTKNTSDTKYIKNIRVESFDEENPCETYIKLIDDAILLINGTGGT